ncbi:MAG: hypothetical protein Q8P46_00340 [Hyphomicrobiales bacterium]|nr:hypothetical protein [Hyphomicrobiales bacterium]
MKFREHRGHLSDSLATQREFQDREEVTRHVIDLLKAQGTGEVPAGLVSFTPYGGDDQRIGWKDVHIVEVTGYGVVGFVDNDTENP